MSIDMILPGAKRSGIGYHTISQSDYGIISLARNPLRSGYESDQDNIINQYIIFCKVFNEQTGQHGMTLFFFPHHKLSLKKL